MKKTLLALALFGFVLPAHAADMVLKAPKANPLTGYISGQCGLYFGLNTMGGAGALNGTNVPGASVIQGDIGATLGYGCPLGAAPGAFWFVEGNFDIANVNGAANGLALTGPAHFEQRLAVGGPLASMLNLFPGLGTGLAVPSLPGFANGVTVGPQYPFLFASLHEQDVSAQIGALQNKAWLVSPGLGVGLESRLSNGVVADVTAQWVLQSSGLGVGTMSVKFGNAAMVGLTLKY